MSKKAQIALGIIVVLQLVGHFFGGANANIILFVLTLIVGAFFIVELIKTNKAEGKTYVVKAIEVLIGVFIVAMIILSVTAIIASTRNKSDNNLNIKCVDSDGGKNYYVRGNATMTNVPADYVSPNGYKAGAISGENANEFSDPVQNNSSSIIMYDYCLNSGGLDLSESYCNEKGEAANESYSCPNGCKDGACIK